MTHPAPCHLCAAPEATGVLAVDCEICGRSWRWAVCERCESDAAGAIAREHLRCVGAWSKGGRA
jgi:hypothetical protein